jgi:formiminotetrahydrofolate cyclodeaminase
LIASVEPTLLGAAAIVSALGGAVSTIWAVRKSKHETQEKAIEDCLARLAETRAEAEKLAEELHELRMKKEEL